MQMGGNGRSRTFVRLIAGMDEREWGRFGEVGRQGRFGWRNEYTNRSIAYAGVTLPGRACAITGAFFPFSAMTNLLHTNRHATAAHAFSIRITRFSNCRAALTTTITSRRLRIVTHRRRHEVEYRMTCWNNAQAPRRAPPQRWVWPHAGE